MPSSGAWWRTRRRLRAAPLDKEEPRISLPRTPVNSLVMPLSTRLPLLVATKTSLCWMCRCAQIFTLFLQLQNRASDGMP
jgi:hypothetical protein